MLSAFTARPIIELRQRDKSKIETILAYGDRVLVGLNTGVLRIYRLNDLSNGSAAPAAGPSPAKSQQPPAVTNDGTAVSRPALTQPAPKSTDLLREIDRFSTRAIEQLAAIKEAGTLVSLSNYTVSLHDLKTLEPIEAPLARTRNASCFAVTSNVVEDPATGIPEFISRLAVAVKRRLLLWSWHASELGTDVDEVLLPEAIRTLTWASATKIVCGMNSWYVLVDVVTKETVDIAGGQIGGAGGGVDSRFGAYSTAGMGYMGLGGYMPKPLATRLAGGEVLLAKDINTLFITADGRPLEKRQIPWQTAPENIGYSYPYLLALAPPAKGSLEVRNPDTLSLLQTLALPGAAQLHFPPPTVSLAHGGKEFHISSDRCVWKMDAIDYDAQVAELVAAARYDEAVSLLDMLEDALLKNKAETMREVKMRKAEMLFRERKFRDAMDLFNEDAVHAPPERVLRLFPPIIAGDLSGVPAAEAEGKDDSDGEDGNGKAAADAQHTKETKTEAPPAEVEHTSRLGGFTRMWGLGGGHRKADAETASIASKRAGGDGDNDTTGSGSGSSVKGRSSTPTEPRPLEGKDLMDATLELNGYLAGARARLQRVIDPATGKLKARGDDVAGLLTTKHVDETDEQLERHLQETFRLVDTSLFRAFMYSRPALAGSLFRIPNFCDPDVVNARLLEQNRYTELVDFFHGKRLHRQALELLRRFGEKKDGAGEGGASEEEGVAKALRGPERTVRYLQSLPPDMIDLILEFSGWTLRADPSLGMEVFLADSERAEMLPRDRVVAFLGETDPELEVRYLDHIITELNDMTPDFHNRLVDVLIRWLKEHDKGTADWERMMERLLRFLRTSRQYGCMRAYNPIKDDPAFYEAQTIVLSIMGQHREALKIYVFKMEDYAKAEEYCNRVHKAEDSQASPTSQARPTSPSAPAPAPTTFDDQGQTEPSIYHTLLSLYLSPPRQQASDVAPPSPKLGPALDLLSKHGSRLPASSSLSLIPDDLPVSALEAYFAGQIRSANSVLNEGRVVARLREAELVAAQARLLLGDDGSGIGGRSRRVVVGDERVCGVCHKRLGGSVIAVLPDNAVVHYGCLGRAQGGGVVGGLRERERGPSWGRVGSL